MRPSRALRFRRMNMPAAYKSPRAHQEESPQGATIVGTTFFATYEGGARNDAAFRDHGASGPLKLSKMSLKFKTILRKGLWA